MDDNYSSKLAALERLAQAEEQERQRVMNDKKILKLHYTKLTENGVFFFATDWTPRKPQPPMGEVVFMQTFRTALSEDAIKALADLDNEKTGTEVRWQKKDGQWDVQITESGVTDGE